MPGTYLPAQPRLVSTIEEFDGGTFLSICTFGWRAYCCGMKTLTQAPRVLLSSPLVWIGAAGALVSFLTSWLLYSGRLQPLARFADSHHLGNCVLLLLAFTFVAGICLVISGIIIGTLRLRQKVNFISR
jgi:hypothetical protein